MKHQHWILEPKIKVNVVVFCLYCGGKGEEVLGKNCKYTNDYCKEYAYDLVTMHKEMNVQMFSHTVMKNKEL